MAREVKERGGRQPSEKAELQRRDLLEVLPLALKSTQNDDWGVLHSFATWYTSNDAAAVDNERRVLFRVAMGETTAPGSVVVTKRKKAQNGNRVLERCTALRRQVKGNRSSAVAPLF